MNQLEEALLQLCNKLVHYRECAEYLPNGSNDKYAHLYDLLLQASLFYENGISTQELMNSLHIGRTTTANRLNILSEYDLLIKESIGNVRSYKLNLDTVDKLTENAVQNG